MAGYLKEFDATRGGDAAHAAATVLASNRGPLTQRGGGASTHDAAIRMTHEASTTRMHAMAGGGSAMTYGPSGWKSIVEDTTGKYSADEKMRAQDALGKLRPRDTPDRLTDRVSAVLARRAASSTMNKADTNSEVFKKQHRIMTDPRFATRTPGGPGTPIGRPSAPMRGKTAFAGRTPPRVAPSM